ncbi:MAG: alcohol dehydrogenase catalytic domain-containing protein [Polyangia bacterium]
MLAEQTLVVEQLAVSLDGERADGMVGRVVEAGSADLVGRAVVVPGVRSCGGCLPCRRGHATLCRTPGAPPTRDARVVVASRHAVVLAPPGDKGLAEPADLAPLAALAGVGLWAYGAVVRASVEPNRAAIIVGGGPLARFVAALVAHRGARALSARSADEVRIALEEHGLEAFGLPVIVVEAGTAQLAIDLAPDGGTVVLCHAQPGEAQLSSLPARGLSMHGVLGAHPDLLPELVAFAHKGALELAPLCRDANDAVDDRAPVLRI